MTDVPVSVFEKDNHKHFTYYDVELTFTDMLLGGIPKDTKVITAWMLAHTKAADSPEILRHRLLETLREIGHDTSELEDISDFKVLEAKIEELAGEIKTQGFKQNGHGLFIEDRGIKAMIKESANIVFATKWFNKATGRPMDVKNNQVSKGLKSLVAEWVYPDPREILVGRDKPDSVEMRTIHSPRGSSLGYFEAAHKPVLNFQIKVLHDLIPAEVWAGIWTHAELNGLGASRSQGYGQFAVTKWERRNGR